MDSVAFSLYPDNVARGKYVAIVSPTFEDWNDFGYRIRVKILVRDPRSPNEPEHLTGFFAFAGEVERESDVGLLTKLLEAAPEGSLEAGRLPGFFTMLPDMQSYRAIVSKLGPDVASRVLVALNDVVAADEGIPGSKPLTAEKGTRVFNLAFLRTSEAFFAWANAGSILRGLQYETFGKISDQLNIGFKLAGRPNEHELSFKFGVLDKALPRRFAVIIGKNGVGKSQALGRIAKAALTGSPSMKDGEGNRPRLNRLIAFAPTSATASVFPGEKTKQPRIWYRRFVVNAAGRSKGSLSTAQLILRLTRSEERIGANDRFTIFMNAISAIDHSQDIALRSLSGSNQGIRLSELRGGSEQSRLQRLSALDLRREPVRIINSRLFPLSSGEQSFLRIAAFASLYIENGSLLLFDEPETHLHPDFISQLVAVLDSLLEQTGSAAIIATHSVYFVREAFEDQVIVLRSDEDNSVRTERPSLKTFGADVGAISYFVFGEDSPSRLAQKVEDQIAEAANSWDQVFEMYKDELSLDLLGEIRDRISSDKEGNRK